LVIIAPIILGFLNVAASVFTLAQETTIQRQIGMRKILTARKQTLRDLVQQAHEEELSRALSVLADFFDDWRSGKIDSREMNQIIHKFHQQTVREISVRYEMGEQRALVANAVAVGILDRQHLPGDLVRDMERLIAYFEADSVKASFSTTESSTVSP